MSKKDPYYTYTDYQPARPAKPKISRTILVLVLAAALALAGATYYGASLLMCLKGG